MSLLHALLFLFATTGLSLIVLNWLLPCPLGKTYSKLGTGLLAMAAIGAFPLLLS